jgi:hypothetical protein
MPDKLTFVKNITAQSDIWTASDAMEHWWQNAHSGWRLTYEGFKALKQYKLEHWDFDAPKLVPTPGLLLALDRKLTAPYYLHIGKDSRVCFFDSKEATMYALYQDVKRFVASLQRY